MLACEIRGEDSGILRKIGDIWVHSDSSVWAWNWLEFCRREGNIGTHAHEVFDLGLVNKVVEESLE